MFGGCGGVCGDENAGAGPGAAPGSDGVSGCGTVRVCAIEIDDGDVGRRWRFDNVIAGEARSVGERGRNAAGAGGDPGDARACLFRIVVNHAVRSACDDRLRDDLR